MAPSDMSHAQLVQRTLIVIGLLALVSALLVLAWQAVDVLLLFFAGVLLGIGLRGVASLLHRHTPLPPTPALIVSLVSFFLLLAAAAWLLGPHLVRGLQQLAFDIPQSVQKLGNDVAEVDWLWHTLQRAMQSFSNGIENKLFSHLAGMFSTALGAITGLLIIVALGVYLSIDPELYIRGAARLLPPSKRTRARQVLTEQGHSLRWWLLGRTSSMLIVGVLTWIGLLLLDVPLAFTLAAIAGLLSFVPNIGPILSAIPAVLVGLSVSPVMALYVVGLYVLVQTVESYMITPVIQQRAVAMPPALLLVVQLVMGVWVGVLGIFLATPLTVAIMVAVRMLYIEDALGDRVES